MSEHVGERLSAYLDGELDSAERSTIDVHLASCMACRALLEQLALVDSAVRQLPQAETDDDAAFAARVRSRVEAQGPREVPRDRRPSRARALPTWAWAAAAALFVAVLTPQALRELRPFGGGAARGGGAASVPASDLARQRAEPALAPPAGIAPRQAPPARPAEARERHEAEAAPRPPAPAPQDAVAKRTAGEKAKKGEDGVAMGVETSVEGGVPGGVVGSVAETSLAFAAPPEETSADRETRTKQDRQARGGLRESEPQARAKAATTAPAAAPAAAPAPAAASQPAPGALADEVAQSEADTFGRLAAQRPRTAAEWRRLREAWRELARTHSDRGLADEARVRAVEAAAAAYRASGEARDEQVLELDAAEYLARDAAQAERVRRVLRGAAR